MNARELGELTNKVGEIKRQIIYEFNNRIKELYVIAKKKGQTEFGWLDDEVIEPDYDDYESDKEYEEACEKYDNFRCFEGRIEFTWMDDHNFINYDGYSFRIGENGISFTRVVNISDTEEFEFEDLSDWDGVNFDPYLKSNWEVCYMIIQTIEYELGL